MGARWANMIVHLNYQSSQYPVLPPYLSQAIVPWVQEKEPASALHERCGRIDLTSCNGRVTKISARFTWLNDNCVFIWITATRLSVFLHPFCFCEGLKEEHSAFAWAKKGVWTTTDTKNVKEKRLRDWFHIGFQPLFGDFTQAGSWFAVYALLEVRDSASNRYLSTAGTCLELLLASYLCFK